MKALVVFIVLSSSVANATDVLDVCEGPNGSNRRMVEWADNTRRVTQPPCGDLSELRGVLFLDPNGLAQFVPYRQEKKR